MKKELQRNKKLKEKIKEKIHSRADIQLGKKGVNESVVNEIKRRLKNQQVIKIRINRNLIKSGIERQEIAQEIEEKTGATIIEIRGNTIILAKKSGKTL